MLTLYRTALKLRRTEAALHGDKFEWLSSAGEVLAFRRGDLLCVVNFGAEPVLLPEHRALLLASGPLSGPALLPTDTAVWLRVA
ncbi:DUF3459 domain-containing protein [Kitasatospora sp. NPDC051853]|uniref:DUF3459 domain-containing protein n=1 Tax=Kitasatospora sp. NPDC051853 TaxID=3364058 RepID=UPI00378DACA3